MPERDSDRDRQARRDQRHLERDARAVEHAREHVLADRVDAEEERRRGPGRRAEHRVERARVLGVRRMRDVPCTISGANERDEDLEDDEAERDERDPVLAGSAPEELPRRPRRNVGILGGPPFGARAMPRASAVPIRRSGSGAEAEM